jgi:LysR family carnitine catabolism transcriptional activator
MITIKNLNAFVNVAKYQSFALASESLHLSQPALSSAIKNLERSLGGNLLVRSTRRVALTPEGASFLPVARRLIDDFDGAILDVKQLFTMESGVLTIAAMPSFAHSILPNLLLSFGYAQPNVSVRVVDEVMESVIQHVLDGRAELGFVFAPENTDSLVFTPLFTEEFIVITPPNFIHKLKRLNKKSITDHKFIAMNRGSSTRSWVDNTFAKDGLRLNIACEASQFETIGNLVATGLGISIVPSLCKQQMQMKGCECFTIDDLGIQRAIGYVTSSEHELSVAAKAFIEAIKR